MNITCLASSSAGNCYLIKTDSDAFLLEAGIKRHQIVSNLMRQKTPMTITRLSGVAVTHHHGDHARSAAELGSYNIPIFASPETLKLAQVKSHQYPIITVDGWSRIINIGQSLELTAFELEHNNSDGTACLGNYGYILYDKIANERLLFINDCKLVKWDFSKSKFDYIMIECNHNDELLDRKDIQIVRTAQSHMSLATCKLTLSKMDLSNTQAIYLMHMSDGNCDQNRCLKEVMELTGKPTYACLKDGGFSE